MEKHEALSILKSRKAITEPGKYRVKCTNVNPFSKQLGNGQQVVAIANFNAMNPYQLEKAKEDLTAGNFNDACNHNLSLSIRSKDYQPQKGEVVDVIIEEIETTSGEKALLITGCTGVKATTSLASVDFSDFEDEAPVAETSEAQGEVA